MCRILRVEEIKRIDLNSHISEKEKTDNEKINSVLQIGSL